MGVNQSGPMSLSIICVCASRVSAVESDGIELVQHRTSRAARPVRQHAQ